MRPKKEYLKSLLIKTSLGVFDRLLNFIPLEKLGIESVKYALLRLDFLT